MNTKQKALSVVLFLVVAFLFLRLMSSDSSDEQTGGVAQPAAAALTSAPAAAAPPARTTEWQQLGSWSGSGAKNTETFATQTSEWRVTWKTANEPFQGAGIFQVYVYAEGGRLVTLAANKQGEGQDVSYVRSPPGKHYLEINSANIDWAMIASEQR